jgi:hypothetical protein
MVFPVVVLVFDFEEFSEGVLHSHCLICFYHRELINTTLPNGITGEVAFNSVGDRKNAKYNILNKKFPNTALERVGHYFNGKVLINESIIWPGLQNTTPKGVFVSNHLRVSSIIR